jgi:chromate transporter
MKYLEVFFTALRLGLTSFGGPIAHLAFFHEEYVKRKKWISEQAYADLVALCQFLPGPASSQVGMAIGLHRAGIPGSILSWVGFTFPSAIILIFFGFGMTLVDSMTSALWIYGLKISAVSVVAHAVFGMAKKLCPDRVRATIAIISSVLVLLINSIFVQIFVLGIFGLYGAYFLKNSNVLPHEPLKSCSSKIGIISLTLFFGLLILLPSLRPISQTFRLFDSFYRTGALVFGGGHVVLPLLQSEVIPAGWISNDLFMAGYGDANAIPGPLFAFSAYVGAVSSESPNGWTGAIICLIASFLPAFLIVLGVLPYWEKIRNIPKIRLSMFGLNASVVGLLLAALYHPVWTSAIFTLKDFALALFGFLLLQIWKFQSWMIVLTTVVLSLIIS